MKYSKNVVHVLVVLVVLMLLIYVSKKEGHTPENGFQFTTRPLVTIDIDPNFDDIQMTSSCNTQNPAAAASAAPPAASAAAPVVAAPPAIQEDTIDTSYGLSPGNDIGTGLTFNDTGLSVNDEGDTTITGFNDITNVGDDSVADVTQNQMNPDGTLVPDEDVFNEICGPNMTRNDTGECVQKPLAVNVECNDGFLSGDVTGGIAPYRFQWYNEGGQMFSESLNPDEPVRIGDTETYKYTLRTIDDGGNEVVSSAFC